MQEKRNVRALLILTSIIITNVVNVFAQDVQWKKHFGEPSVYRSVTAVSDGIIAVGNVGSIGLNGGTSAIVKYDNNGNVAWKKNFGGISDNVYNSVTAVSDGIVVAGYGAFKSFNTDDWTETEGKGEQDAIIIKYNNNGEIIWKKNFGGSGPDFFNSITAVSDGIIAVGQSNGNSFGNGDWENIAGKGTVDAIMVKYDNNGNVVWKKNFGGTGWDYYYSVVEVSDGVIAVGESNGNSFGNGDWENIAGKGNVDAIIVKYNNNGNVVWKKNFGGSGGNFYNSATAVSDGIVAVGRSGSSSFGNADWVEVAGKGDTDAIIVRYDNSGNVVWKKNFGGNDADYYNSVTAVSDGIVAVGYSAYNSFDTGDWAEVTAKGNDDAIMVKYDNNGNPVWKRSFGDMLADRFNFVMAVSDEIIAAGYSYLNSIGSANTGDWKDVSGNGSEAIIVKYTEDNSGISEVYENPNIKIYPNLINDNFSIECECFSIIRLYDMLGKEVLSQNINGKTEVNISHLSKGIYNVIIFSENKVIGSSRIVKQ